MSQKKDETPEEPGTLKMTEHHPAADSAMRYVQSLCIEDLMMWQESFASCAISGNRLAEVCSETVRRLLASEPVSDRYLLGLAWTIRDLADQRKDADEKDIPA